MCLCRPRRWDECLERPQLDYSEIFYDDVGQIPGRSAFDMSVDTLSLQRNAVYVVVCRLVVMGIVLVVLINIFIL